MRKAALKTATPDDLVATIELEVLRSTSAPRRSSLERARTAPIGEAPSDEAEIATLREQHAYADQPRPGAREEHRQAQIIRAPRAGTVVYPTNWRGEKKKVGDNAWRAEVVLQVVALDKMIGKGEVDEVDISRLAVDQPVSLRLDALPDVQLKGKVTEIARTVQQKSWKDPSKVLELELALDPTTSPLRPGMRFRGEVETERVSGVVLIPVDAVFVTPEGPVAYRDQGGEIETVRLELGRRSSTMIEVIRGVAPGDRVSRVDPDRGGT